MTPPLWSLERGATLVAPDAVRFSVWAPNCQRVAVRVEGGACDGVERAMERHGLGVWEVTVTGVRAGDRYRYVVDGPSGRQELPDPVSRFQPEGVHGPSQVVDPGAFRWTDGAWTGLAMADYVIYELHVGTFSEAGTFDGVAAHLAELRQLGVTAIELMPVAQFPGSRNWGYDGVLPYAPQSTYGGPEGLRRLVNAAHDAGLAVVLDCVYNHVGPEGNYLGSYGPYFTDRYKTPWGLAVNFDGPDSDEVRRFVIDNALYWVTEFHVDALRLDAVHAIYDLSARHVLDELAAAVREQGRRMGRRTVVIAESDLNDPRLLRPAERGGYALDAQWSDDFHHAVHAQLTGERGGYYADFGGVAPIAASLRDRFVYDGRYSAHRRRRHGAPAGDVSGEHFVVCLQNHDQVGNRATGERLSALVGFEQLKLAAALLLLSPYVPMLFMGEEYGEPRPFQYFVSHGDPELVEAVRTGRREEFAAFAWEGEVPDPQSADTFLGSVLDRAHGATPNGSVMLSLYRDLLRLRREERALRPGDAEVRVECGDAEGWIRMELRPTPHTHRGAPPERQGATAGVGSRHPADATRDDSPRPRGTLLALFNLADQPRRVPPPARHGGEWTPIFATDDRGYGGADERDDGTEAWVIPPFTARAYRYETAR